MSIYGNTFSNGTIIINEELIYSGKDISIYIDGDGKEDRGYCRSPYIKVYNAINSSKASKECRIGFDDEGNTQYIVHNDQNNILTSKEIKELISAMNKTPNGVSKVRGYNTVSDAIKNMAKQKSDNPNCTAAQDILRFKDPDFSNIASNKDPNSEYSKHQKDKDGIYDNKGNIKDQNKYDQFWKDK